MWNRGANNQRTDAPVDGGGLNSLYASLIPTSPAAQAAASSPSQGGDPETAALLAALQQATPAAAGPAPRNWYAGPMTPEQDPQYMAFTRALGYSDEQAQAQTMQRKQMLENSWNRQLPIYQDQLNQQDKSIEGDYTARGVHSSGQRVTDEDQAALQQQNRMSAAKGDIQDKQADMDMQLAAQLADSRRQQAEQSLAAQQRIAISMAQGSSTGAP